MILLASLFLFAGVVAATPDALLEQIRESGFELATLVEQLDEDATLQAWEEEAERLNARIQRLGPINLAAIEEYEEQSERKQYLDAQNEDLEAALAQAGAGVVAEPVAEDEELAPVGLQVDGQVVVAHEHRVGAGGQLRPDHMFHERVGVHLVAAHGEDLAVGFPDLRIVIRQQNARLALKFSQKGYVLENGNLVLEGDSQTLINDPG